MLRSPMLQGDALWVAQSPDSACSEVTGAEARARMRPDTRALGPPDLLLKVQLWFPQMNDPGARVSRDKQDGRVERQTDSWTSHLASLCLLPHLQNESSNNNARSSRDSSKGYRSECPPSAEHSIGHRAPCILVTGKLP